MNDKTVVGSSKTRANAAARKTIQKALRAAQKKIRCLSTAALNSNLEHFCGDFAEAYRTGVEEAQGEIITRLRELERALQPAAARLATGGTEQRAPQESISFSPNFDERNGIK